MRQPRAVYSVTVEGGKDGVIVIRTSNKKYYKRIEIPDMQRAGLPLAEAALSHRWRANSQTMEIRYRKPPQVLAVEQAARMERARATDGKEARDGDVECPQQ